MTVSCMIMVAAKCDTAKLYNYASFISVYRWNSLLNNKMNLTTAVLTFPDKTILQLLKTNNQTFFDLFVNNR